MQPSYGEERIQMDFKGPSIAFACVLFAASPSPAGSCSTHWDLLINVASTSQPIHWWSFYADAQDAYAAGTSIRGFSNVGDCATSVTRYNGGAYFSAGEYSAGGLGSGDTMTRCRLNGEALASDFQFSAFGARDSNDVPIDPSPSAEFVVVCSACGNGIVDAGEDCDPGIPGQECCNPTTCDQTPAQACLASPDRSARLQLKNLEGGASDSLKWTWKGSSFTHEMIGDPTTDQQLRLCIWHSYYDSEAEMTVSELKSTTTVAPGTGWSSKEPKGYKFIDSLGAQSGVRKVQIAADDYNAKVQIVAKGASLLLPEPVSETQYFPTNFFGFNRVRVQMIGDICWDSLLYIPYKPSSNSGTTFKAWN
jgi:hypothetical protein